jgi:hypothetical protein
VYYLGDSVGDLLELDAKSKLSSDSGEGVAGGLGGEGRGAGKTRVDLKHKHAPSQNFVIELHKRSPTCFPLLLLYDQAEFWRGAAYHVIEEECRNMAQVGSIA